MTERSRLIPMIRLYHTPRAPRRAAARYDERKIFWDVCPILTLFLPRIPSRLFSSRSCKQRCNLMHELRRAVFYPHSTIRDSALLKRALLFYDEVELLVPHGRHPLIAEGALRDVSEHEARGIHAAAEFLLRQHVPTENDHRRAHELIERLVERPTPAWFAFEPHHRYEIYPEKFMLETWRMLSAGKLAWRQVGQHPDYEVHSSLGLSLMGILARVRAGTTREKVTDVVDAHRAYMHYVAALADGIPDAHKVSKIHPRLETITLPGIDLRHAKIEKLLELRQNEDAFVKRLRRNFQKALADFRERLGECSADEHEAVFDNFKDDLDDDLKHLEEHLSLSRRSTVTRTGAALMNLKIGDAVEGLAAGLEAVEQLPAFRLQRQEVLEAHPSAWLYVAGKKSK